MTYSATDAPKLADELGGISYSAFPVAPATASPAAVIIEGTSLIVAEAVAAMDLTAEQLTATEGLLNGIPQNGAIAATLTTTWTSTSGSAVTIDAGATVQVTDGTGATSFWSTQTATTFTTTTTTGQVVLVAQQAGTPANGVTGTALLISPKYSWLGSITVASPGVGGVDAETPSAYFDRLSTALANRGLIMKADQLAARVSLLPGVGRALAIRTYNPTGPDPAAPGHMTVAVADSTGSNYSAIWPTILALPTADGVTIHAVNFNRHAIAIRATVVKQDDWDAAQVKAACEEALAAAYSPLAYAARPVGELQSMTVEPTVRMDQVAAILNQQAGVRYLSPYSAVLIGVDGGSLTHADATLTGDFPLTYVATPATDIVVTVV